MLLLRRALAPAAAAAAAAAAVCARPAASAEARQPGRGQELCIALRHGDLGAARALLRADQSMANDRHPGGWAPLHVAALSGEPAMARLLLEAGADPNLQDHFELPRDWGLRQSLARIRMREFSESIMPAADTHGFAALHYAVLADDVPMVRELLRHPDTDPTVRTRNGHTPADFVADGFSENAEVLREMLAAKETEVAARQAERRRQERLARPLEARLHEKVVGQPTAIRAVAGAVRRKENGWSDPDHPLVALFLGTSGIGKTEVAKQTARYLHGEKDTKGFVRLDMSEYGSRHEMARLIGSPPGYVGHEEGGQLVEKLKACPDAVVLLDEIDKAHPDVLTVMLQLFDEGRLTSGRGETVECPNAVFLMTANVAAREIAAAADMLRETTDHSRAHDEFRDEVLGPILRKHFRRDEFLGRINEIVIFLPFNDAELASLVELELRKWAQRAMDRHGISLTWDGAVIAQVAQAYNPNYGARSIQHEVDRRIVNKLAAAHERGRVKAGDKVHLIVEGAGIEVRTNKEL